MDEESRKIRPQTSRSINKDIEEPDNISVPEILAAKTEAPTVMVTTVENDVEGAAAPKPLSSGENSKNEFVVP